MRGFFVLLLKSGNGATCKLGTITLGEVSRAQWALPRYSFFCFLGEHKASMR